MALRAVKGGGRRWKAVKVAAALCTLAARGAAQDTSAVRASNDSLSVRFVEADLRAVIQTLGRYLAKPVLVGAIQPVRVSLETPRSVHRSAVAGLLRGLVEAQNLQLTEDSAFFRIGPRAPETPDRPSARPADRPGQAGEQLDIRPLQVLIEVMIVEARHDRRFSLGTDFLVPPQRTDHGNGTVDAAETGGGLGDVVIHLMNLGHAQIDATLRAAASKGDVEIVSRPVLLTSNNTEARLLVGSQR